LRALAEHLKLSQATVSVVMNNSPAAQAIPKHTKERVLRAAEKLGYRPNFFARSLSLKRGYMVGVLVPEISEGYAASILRGREDELLSQGYFYFMASHRGQAELIREYPHMLVDRAVEGMILLNTPVVQVLDVPVVAISGHQRVPGVTNIAVDNKQATLYRWKGVQQAATKLGIAVSPRLTAQLQQGVTHPGPSVPEEGYESAKKLLEAGEHFTALFAFNDISAVGAVRAFRDAGLRVPEDVSVVGFDDIQAAAYLTPRLTTVRQPLRLMGETAAKQLLERIARGNGRYPQVILLPPELVVRESTGPARA
jgi:LacI family transcriptional regulator